MKPTPARGSPGSRGGEGTVTKMGSANTANHTAANSMAARTFWPSATGTPRTPRVSPSPEISVTYTISSSITLPKYPMPEPNPEIRPDVCGVESWRSNAL
jgi:hypothetical protein